MTSNPTSSLKQSLGELLGLARGLMADEELTNSEIRFLHDWLEERYEMTSSFPGNIIHQRIKEVLEDNVITEEERSHLVETLNMLIDDLTTVPIQLQIQKVVLVIHDVSFHFHFLR